MTFIRLKSDSDVTFAMDYLGAEDINRQGCDPRLGEAIEKALRDGCVIYTVECHSQYGDTTMDYYSGDAAEVEET